MELSNNFSPMQCDNFWVVMYLVIVCSLLEALDVDVMHEGVQNLVIPIQNQFESVNSNNVHHNDNTTYCWLTQEDVFRYLLNSIGVFSPTSGNPINTLGVIDTQNLLKREKERESQERE